MHLPIASYVVPSLLFDEVTLKKTSRSMPKDPVSRSPALNVVPASCSRTASQRLRLRLWRRGRCHPGCIQVGADALRGIGVVSSAAVVHAGPARHGRELLACAWNAPRRVVEFRARRAAFLLGQARSLLRQCRRMRQPRISPGASLKRSNDLPLATFTLAALTRPASVYRLPDKRDYHEQSALGEMTIARGCCSTASQKARADFAAYLKHSHTTGRGALKAKQRAPALSEGRNWAISLDSAIA